MIPDTTPWTVTLLELERLKASDTHWEKFGFDQLDIPDTAPHVKARMEILEGRFLANYGWRFLSYETMEQWQVKLQERMDSIVDMYERAYTLYEANHDAMMSDVLPGTVLETESESQASGSDAVSASGTDTTEGTVKSSDTPDSLINDSDDYAGSIDKTHTSIAHGRTDTTEYGRKDKTNTKQTMIRTGAEIMDSVNRSIDGWRDIDTSLILRFESLFSGIWWY